MTEKTSSFVFNPVKVAEKMLKTGDFLCVDGRFFLYKRGLFFYFSHIEIYRKIKEFMGTKYRERYGREVIHCMELERLKRFEDINSHKNMLNLKDGMFDLDNMILFPHDPKYLSTIQLDLIYNKDAKCDLWEKTLNEIFLDVHWKIECLQEYMGYCLTTDNSYQLALLNVGQGANGKSLIYRVFEAILGQYNISSVPMAKLKDQHYLAELFGKLVNISLESEAIEELSDANFKAIVSGDRITADEKYKKPFSFYPFCKLIFSMNTLPFVNDKTEAFYRRILILNYEKQFKTGEQNRNLYKELLEEIPGIFNWMVEGLERLRKRGSFNIPDGMQKLIDEYKKDNNPTLSFIEENLDRGKNTTVSKKDVYNKYVLWCKENGYKTSSDKSLGKNIRTFFNGTVVDGRNNIRREWVNLQWKAENVDWDD